MLKGLRYSTTILVALVMKLGNTWLLRDVFGVHEDIAYGISLFLIFVLNFLLYRYYVYRNLHMSWHEQFAKFGASTLTFVAVDYTAFRILHPAARWAFARLAETDRLPEAWSALLLDKAYLVAILLLAVVLTTTKFIFYNYFIFGKPRRDADG